jgi:hypothetical protein
MCKVAGFFDYSYKSASKYAENSPCTNVLMECPECKKKKTPMGQFFWKYHGMVEHWQRKHPSIEKPRELVEALKLHPKELAGLKTFATSKGRGGQARKRARAQTRPRRLRRQNAELTRSPHSRRLSRPCHPERSYWHRTH